MYWLLGCAALLANKPRHLWRGYRFPRPFSISDSERAFAYDVNVVDRWMMRLSEYLGYSYSLEGKDVLELGPGADLGVGLYLLSQGVGRYHAIDVTPLAAGVPHDFYQRFLTHLATRTTMSADRRAGLLQEIVRSARGEAGRLDYRCSSTFDLGVFRQESIDLFVSQAAFEHLECFPETARQMASQARRDALLVAEIDLNTHTRWLRDNDPHSIYRYPDWFYRLCRFPGIPSRLRPRQYVDALEASGWTDVRVTALTVVSEGYLSQVQPHLARRFRSEDAEMGLIHVTICARRNR
jgi:hypothetical protein